MTVSSQERSPGKKVVKQTDDFKQNGGNACVDISSNLKRKERDIETKERCDGVLEGENQEEKSAMLPEEETSTREAKCAATSNLQKVSCCEKLWCGMYLKSTLFTLVYIAVALGFSICFIPSISKGLFTNWVTYKDWYWNY